MAIIGPRPLLVRYLDRYNDEQRHRHDVRPGLTGYAQAHGRNGVSWEDKFPEDYDFEAHKKLVPMQPGDVPVTYADTTALEEDFGFRPSTSLRDGLRKFAEWYKEFYM